MSCKHLAITERDCSETANIFDRARSTIYRELKRLGECPYDPERAHDDYLYKRTRCRAVRKLASEDMHKYVLHHLKNGWTPEQIERRGKLKGMRSIDDRPAIAASHTETGIGRATRYAESLAAGRY